MGSSMRTMMRPVGDMRDFLRDAASSTIRYSSERGANHQVFFPFKMVDILDEEGNKVGERKEIYAVSGWVHEWTTPDGKFHSVVCSQNNEEEGYQGDCPFCLRASDAYDIVVYRMNREEELCKLEGADKEKHMKESFKQFCKEKKSNRPVPYLYILIAKFKNDKKTGDIVINRDTKLPEYELKVMRLSKSRVEKINEQVQNAGSELGGSEIIFGYTDDEDKRLQVSQGSITLVFPDKKITTLYPGLLEVIDNDARKFDFEGIEQGFSEWKGMTNKDAKIYLDKSFGLWDQYLLEKEHNPDAKYAEYNTTSVNTPSLAGDSGQANFAGQMGAVQMPTLPGSQGAAGFGQMPTVPGGQGAMGAFGAGSMPGMNPPVDAAQTQGVQMGGNQADVVMPGAGMGAATDMSSIFGGVDLGSATFPQ